MTTNESSVYGTETASLLEEAIMHHRAGHLKEAEYLYQVILRNQPDHPDALHLLGVIFQKVGQHKDAAELINKAITIDSLVPEFYNSLGAVNLSMGNEVEAINLYLHAIEINNDYLAPYNNLLRLRPLSVDVRYNFACALQRIGNTEESMQQYTKVLELQPAHPEACNNQGCALRTLGRLDEAIAHLRRAVDLQPDYAIAYHNLGYTLQEKGLFNEAVTSYHNALSLKPDFTDAQMDLGRALQAQGHINKAISQYQKAINLTPNHAKAYYNWACALHELNRTNNAIEKYEKAISYNPDFVEAHVNKALILLINGRYLEGWPSYEWRLQRPDWQQVNSFYPGLPRWDGTNVQNKCIMVQAEQGFGDTIQFARFLPDVKSRCGKLIIEAQPELHALLKTIPVIDELVEPQPENANKADFCIHIMSLPKVFGTTIETIPKQSPYLHVPKSRLKKWQNRISSDGFKIGIAWSGNPAYPANESRSFQLSHFAALASLPTVRLFSLQKGKASEQIKQISTNMPIVNLDSDIHDFADTAAAIMQLDMIISVDTALVHLTGALNRPIWTLRYHMPYWVWGIQGDSSPWYPSMRIFRQQNPGDWDEVFREVAKELKKVLCQSEQVNILSLPQQEDYSYE